MNHDVKAIASRLSLRWPPTREDLMATLKVSDEEHGETGKEI